MNMTSLVLYEKRERERDSERERERESKPTTGCVVWAKCMISGAKSEALLHDVCYYPELLDVWPAL